MGTERQKIFITDDSRTNLRALETILSPIYEVSTAGGGAELFKLLEQALPALILLDIEMPVMDGFEVIKILKAHPAHAAVPVIFLTGKNDAESELEGLSLGAVDYIFKPFSPPLLKKRLEMHLLIVSQKKQLQDYNDNLHAMVERKTQTVREMQDAVFKLMSEIIDYRDDTTGGHIARTQKYFAILLEGLRKYNVYPGETDNWDTRIITLCSQLHDVGKVGIRDAVLLKPDRLTPDEFAEMRKHAVIGANIINRVEKTTSESSFITHAKLMAATHHEKWDGNGYPLGLSGHSIPLQGRLMAIVDVYDALVSSRPYKEAMTHERAASIIIEGAGSHFDPALVAVFIKVADLFREVAGLAH